MKYTPLFIIGFILWLSACTDNQLLPSSPDDGEKPMVKRRKELYSKNVMGIYQWQGRRYKRQEQDT